MSRTKPSKLDSKLSGSSGATGRRPGRVASEEPEATLLADTKEIPKYGVPQNSYFLQGVLGVHDGSVVWSGVRMRGYPPRCVTSKSIRLDEFCDACQGRVETVLDCFQSCQSVERVGR